MQHLLSVFFAVHGVGFTFNEDANVLILSHSRDLFADVVVNESDYKRVTFVLYSLFCFGYESIAYYIVQTFTEFHDKPHSLQKASQMHDLYKNIWIQMCFSMWHQTENKQPMQPMHFSLDKPPSFSSDEVIYTFYDTLRNHLVFKEQDMLFLSSINKKNEERQYESFWSRDFLDQFIHFSDISIKRYVQSETEDQKSIMQESPLNTSPIHPPVSNDKVENLTKDDTQGNTSSFWKWWKY